jgi:intein/homing endonuclease
MPDKLYELTTCSGRKIKATIDHPFLVNTGEGYVWKSLGKMVLTDKIIIRHSVKHLPEEQTVSPPVIIRKPVFQRCIASLTAAGILEENCR